MEVWARERWTVAAAAHRERVRGLTGPYRERAARGETHPVIDFLFVYYSHRPSLLERWHPGPGLVLAGAEEYLRWAGYEATAGGVRVRPRPGGYRTARFVRELLAATASRPPMLGCFGLHEWAMVYRQPPREVRHGSTPLRLGPAGTDAVLESLPVRCSHHDAFRFFTAAARPRNALQPGRADQVRLEQPGCLHATMDLYKWAYKLAPVTPSELVADCLELALATRELDMRASPYDLSALGYEPVPIETAEGRARYAREQAGLARRAAPLRARLIELCDTLLAHPDAAPALAADARG
ncbi:MAG TPA: 3-methyladenine DNA glycosylase [Pseudonocardiaceae bacterium]